MPQRTSSKCPRDGSRGHLQRHVESEGCPSLAEGRWDLHAAAPHPPPKQAPVPKLRADTRQAPCGARTDWKLNIQQFNGLGLLFHLFLVHSGFCNKTELDGSEIGISYSRRGWKSKIKVLATLGSAEGPRPHCALWLCPHLWKELATLWGPIHDGGTLVTQSSLKSPPTSYHHSGN